MRKIWLKQRMVLNGTYDWIIDSEDDDIDGDVVININQSLGIWEIEKLMGTSNSDFAYDTLTGETRGYIREITFKPEHNRSEEFYDYMKKNGIFVECCRTLSKMKQPRLTSAFWYENENEIEASGGKNNNEYIVEVPITQTSDEKFMETLNNTPNLEYMIFVSKSQDSITFYGVYKLDIAKSIENKRITLHKTKDSICCIDEPKICPFAKMSCNTLGDVLDSIFGKSH